MPNYEYIELDIQQELRGLEILPSDGSDPSGTITKLINERPSAIDTLESKPAFAESTFGQIYDLYKNCFPLETEQVEPGEFIRAMLRSDTMGAEKWIYAVDKDSNDRIVGATNFNVFAGNPARNPDDTPFCDGTIHETFTFVDPDPKYRGRGGEDGLFRKLSNQRETVSQSFVEASGQFNAAVAGHKKPLLYTIIEQNNPLLMTAEEILADPMNPFLRRHIFEKAGVRPLDMRYLQPSTTIGGEPCTVLDLCIKAPGGKELPPGTRIPAELLSGNGGHFPRWFNITFPPGTELSNDALAPMRPSLRGPITTLEGGRYEKLANALETTGRAFLKEKYPHHTALIESQPRETVISVMLNELKNNPRTRGKPLGELFPDVAIDFFGKEGVRKYRDILPKTAEKALAASQLELMAADKRQDRSIDQDTRYWERASSYQGLQNHHPLHRLSAEIKHAVDGMGHLASQIRHFRHSDQAWSRQNALSATPNSARAQPQRGAER